MTGFLSHLDEIAPDVLLGRHERDCRDRVRAVVQQEVAPRAGEVDLTGAGAGEGYRTLASAGLAGLAVPERYGGTGHSTPAYAAAVEEIAAACGSTSTLYMTQMHAAWPVLNAGDESLRRRLLPPLCAGDAFGSLAVTEPSGGSDAAALRTTARRDGDGYVLDGIKCFITSGDVAGVLVVFATIDPSAGRRGITAFCVEAGTLGLSTGPPLDKLGMRGSSTVEVLLDGCRVPASARLGEEGSGYALLLASVTKSRLSAAAQGVGLARGALAHALDWARRTGRMARSGLHAQDVQYGFGEFRARIQAGRALLYSVAACLDGSGAGQAGPAVAAAKLHCTDLAVAVADGCMALMGDDGDLVELGVERFMRDAKVTQIYDGTNQLQRMLLARDTRARVGSA